MVPIDPLGHSLAYPRKRDGSNEQKVVCQTDVLTYPKSAFMCVIAVNSLTFVLLPRSK